MLRIELRIAFVFVGLAALLGCSSYPDLKTGPTINPPTVSQVSPRLGSTEGGTYVTVGGYGFKPGLVATLDGVPLNISLNVTGNKVTSFSFIAPAHIIGAAEVLVRYSDGEVQASPDPYLARYSWAPPDTFDFNGSWNAFQGNGNPNPFTFTVDENVLLDVTCDDGTVLTLPTPVRVSQGQITVISNGSVVFSAKLRANSQAVGTVDFGTCHSPNWTGWKEGGGSTQRKH